MKISFGNLLRNLLGYRMSHERLPDIIRLPNVRGYEARCNDIVYCRPWNPPVDGTQSVCVFFGGDVQDFAEHMLSHRDNKHHARWSLENTAKILQNGFVDSHILVVRPARMEYRTFSCYDNFVPCVNCGVPEHVPLHYSLVHLQRIVSNVAELIRDMPDEEFEEAAKAARNGLELVGNNAQEESPERASARTLLNLNDSEVILAGFSKGCVVLNQFLYEFHYYNENTSPSDPAIISRIREMYWLDGGHSGGKNTWVTSSDLLGNLARLGIKVFVHVSPYQIDDDRRPWIRKEEKRFAETLGKLGAMTKRTAHFDGIPASIENHFEILRIFKNDVD
ncbi:unnamed protein product [Phyllotreta striolata]|uniref:Uncharacterized protein n=1 Tax=Phyllotreta striolata TaxID=444603 RepID=A0A9N9XM55_PHYSR|nr:unnamed protein product [Phyllotreta striolata]